LFSIVYSRKRLICTERFCLPVFPKLAENLEDDTKLSKFVYMKGQNILKGEILAFTLEKIEARIKNDFLGFVTDFEAFSARKLTLTDADLGLDRKTLYNWKKQGLLPFTDGPSDKGKNKIWGRFSFIELCWLKMLMEFRTVGLGIDKLKEIKALFYPEGFVELLFSKPIENLALLPDEVYQIAEEKQLLKQGKLLISDTVKEEFKKIQFSLFSCLLYATMLSKSNYLFYADGDGKFDVIDLNHLMCDPIEGMMEFHKLLNTKSVVFVNIRKIIADLSGTHEHFSRDLHFGQMLSDASVNTLRALFKDGQVKEVVIRVNENGRPLAWIKRELGMDELEKEVRKIRKRGNFCDLVVKTRDGKVQYFEHTEIVKL